MINLHNFRKICCGIFPLNFSIAGNFITKRKYQKCCVILIFYIFFFVTLPCKIILF